MMMHRLTNPKKHYTYSLQQIFLPNISLSVRPTFSWFSSDISRNAFWNVQASLGSRHGIKAVFVLWMFWRDLMLLKQVAPQRFAHRVCLFTKKALDVFHSCMSHEMCLQASLL